MAIRKQVSSGARTGTITALEKQGDFQFFGKIADDRTRAVLEFEYDTKNPALGLGIGDKVEFQSEVGEPGRAIRIRKLGYNYGTR